MLACCQLKIYEEYTAAKLAELYEVPPGTMATRIMRARKRLRAAMEALTDQGLAETTMRSLAGRLECIAGDFD